MFRSYKTVDMDNVLYLPFYILDQILLQFGKRRVIDIVHVVQSIHVITD